MTCMGLDRFVTLDRVVIRIWTPSGFEITEDDYNAFIQEIKEGEFHLLDHDSVGWGVVYLTFCPENNEQEGLRTFCANVLGKYLKEV